MKTKKAPKTNTKSRIIFFAIALTYNLLRGLYLKDFIVLSPMFTTFYLLSALPTLFFVLKIMMFFGIVDSSCGKDKLLTKFVPIVKPTRKRFERSTSGSYRTVSTIIK